jgi:hypothetical protein
VWRIDQYFHGDPMRPRLRPALAVALTSALLTAAAVVHAQHAPRLPLRAAAETITAADLLRDITYLASDELAGRLPPNLVALLAR